MALNWWTLGRILLVSKGGEFMFPYRTDTLNIKYTNIILISGTVPGNQTGQIGFCPTRLFQLILFLIFFHRLTFYLEFVRPMVAFYFSFFSLILLLPIFNSAVIACLSVYHYFSDCPALHPFHQRIDHAFLLGVSRSSSAHTLRAESLVALMCDVMKEIFAIKPSLTR